VCDVSVICRQRPCYYDTRFSSLSSLSLFLLLFFVLAFFLFLSFISPLPWILFYCHCLFPVNSFDLLARRSHYVQYRLRIPFFFTFLSQIYFPFCLPVLLKSVIWTARFLFFFFFFFFDWCWRGPCSIAFLFVSMMILLRLFVVPLWPSCRPFRVLHSHPRYLSCLLHTSDPLLFPSPLHFSSHMSLSSHHFLSPPPCP